MVCRHIKLGHAAKRLVGGALRRRQVVQREPFRQRAERRRILCVSEGMEQLFVEDLLGVPATHDAGREPPGLHLYAPLPGSAQHIQPPIHIFAEMALARTRRGRQLRVWIGRDIYIVRRKVAAAPNHAAEAHGYATRRQSRRGVAPVPRDVRHNAGVCRIVSMPMRNPVRRAQVYFHIALDHIAATPHLEDCMAEIRPGLKVPHAWVPYDQIYSAHGTERRWTQGRIIPDRLHMPLGNRRSVAGKSLHATSFSAAAPSSF